MPQALSDKECQPTLIVPTIPKLFLSSVTQWMLLSSSLHGALPSMQLSHSLRLFQLLGAPYQVPKGLCEQPAQLPLENKTNAEKLQTPDQKDIYLGRTTTSRSCLARRDSISSNTWFVGRKACRGRQDILMLESPSASKAYGHAPAILL